jgi:hypothetical protein
MIRWQATPPEHRRKSREPVADGPDLQLNCNFSSESIKLGRTHMVWFGADPGGKTKFGVAVLRDRSSGRIAQQVRDRLSMQARCGLGKDEHPRSWF